MESATHTQETMMSEEKSPTFQNLMDRAYDRWQSAEQMSKQAFWDQLDAAERVAVFCGNMNYQVENGGFAQWLDNGYGTDETIRFIIRLNKRLDTDAAKQVNELLFQLLATLRNFRIEDPSDTWRDLDECDADEFMDCLNPLDTKFYDVNDAWCTDLEALLTKEPEPA
jgi:hypothetical protein